MHRRLKRFGNFLVILICVLFTLFFLSVGISQESNGIASNTKPTRVFIFAGQSNMEGADSKVADIKNFPPFVGLENPQPAIKFSYCLGRENKTKSDGWEELKPVRNMVGPELSFARKLSKNIDTPIAIIKVAAGGTHLGGDWNPDDPIGFKMYPLAMDWIKNSLDKLTEKKIPYRIEAVMWHQGENDMFNEEYKKSYGKNLQNFLECWRRDLKTPKLPFFVGELCTKTIWGMDLRPRMYAISKGQKFVTTSDPLATYVPTSHVGVEIGNPVGLHYHYGTLGQLEHGVNYADAYLKHIGLEKLTEPNSNHSEFEKWPYEKGSKVKLFVLAGHRNMEGERAYVQELAKIDSAKHLLKPMNDVAFRYVIGDSYRTSIDWEPLRPCGLYGHFGPELSFADSIKKKFPDENIAIAKFTHSGSQIIDWTPEGSMAKSRNLYQKFISFIKESESSLSQKGHKVELAGVVYHVGENDMSFYPFRKQAAERILSFIEASRSDLGKKNLRWYLSQQPPTDHKSVNKLDVVADVATLANGDSNIFHLKAFDLPKQEERLVISTEGIIELGRLMAERVEK